MHELFLESCNGGRTPMLTPRSIVVIGATSTLALAVSKVYASHSARFFLVGRNEERLHDAARWLQSHGAASCAIFIADVRQKDLHEQIVNTSAESLGTIDLVVIAHGVYPNAEEAEQNVDLMLDSILTNAVSVLSLMHRYATQLKQQVLNTQTGKGYPPCIAVFSSVAGDRGRRNNYIYGSAKACVTAYASGLRARLSEHGVRVVTIKPGPVRTPMTQHLHMPLISSPERVASDVVRAIAKCHHVVYTPWYWRWIMALVKVLPERLFMRIKR